MIFLVYEDIQGFDVTVDDVFRMEVFYGLEELVAHFPKLLLRIVLMFNFTTFKDLLIMDGITVWRSPFCAYSITM
jgi:hypothetical protein